MNFNAAPLSPTKREQPLLSSSDAGDLPDTEMHDSFVSPAFSISRIFVRNVSRWLGLKESNRLRPRFIKSFKTMIKSLDSSQHITSSDIIVTHSGVDASP